MLEYTTVKEQIELGLDQVDAEDREYLSELF
jgi:hypothetical protein